MASKRRLVWVVVLCGAVVFPGSVLAGTLVSPSYTIEGPRVGGIAQITLTSPNYTLIPGSALETSPGNSSGSRTGSRIRLAPEEATFISGTVQTLVPSNPLAVPLLGREERAGVLTDSSRNSQDALGEGETAGAEEATVRNARMGASAIGGAGALFDERAPRVALLFFVLALLLYVRARTAWGRKYRPF